MESPNPAGLFARARLLRARAAEARERSRIADQEGEPTVAAARRGLSNGLRQGADQFDSYAEALRKKGPVKVQSITRVEIKDGGRSLILTDGDGHQFDIARVVFADRFTMRDVGDTPSFMERGLDVTFAIETHGQEPLISRAEAAVVNSSSAERIVPPIAEMPPLPEPNEEIRERWVKYDSPDVRTVIDWEDDHAGNKTLHVPVAFGRKLMMAAGFERVYVRPDVEIDRVSGKEEAAAEKAAPERPTWDTMSLEDAETLPQFPHPSARSPRTARGHLMFQYWTQIHRARSLDEASVGSIEGMKKLVTDRNAVTVSIYDLNGAIRLLDNVGRERGAVDRGSDG